MASDSNILPRVTTLVRVPDARALQRAIVSRVPAGVAARGCAVVVPTRSAAEQLRRTIETQLLASSSESARVMPDLVTRAELYERLHARLADAPPMLTEFERDVLLRLSAEDAERDGIRPPFKLRPGLLVAILDFYDELRRRGRTIDSLDRHVRGTLEGVADTDKGAARLLEQTGFLSAAFAAFERRLANSGGIDEHMLRPLVLSSPLVPAYRHAIVTVADQAADPRGLWPVDFDLLTRVDGLERLDVVATERVLATGYHQRLHDALPGLEEDRVTAASEPPVLLAPEHRVDADPIAWFVSRDREEELADAARWIKKEAREGAAQGEPVHLDRMAVVFQRPLPYLYLGRHVFGAARVPYQALDSLPLAAEPFAAALDLLFTVAAEQASRTPLVDLLTSPHWRFVDPAAPQDPIGRAQVAALDVVLRDTKYLGGWDRLEAMAGRVDPDAAPGTREARRWLAALPALRAAVALGPLLEPLRSAPRASLQIATLLDVIGTHGVVPDEEDPEYERHMRAREAVTGALRMLRDAHAAHDDRSVPLVDLIATIRRWIEDQTFTPRAGRGGVLLVDAPAAAFASVDAVRLVGLVEPDWPERTTSSIFYPANLLRDIGWSPESERLSAARARFQDLLTLASRQVSVSTFTLEEDSLVPPSPFLEDVLGSGLVVTRTATEQPFRVFEHEALATSPLAANAVTGTAAEWLTVRRSRTPQADARYHGTIGARVADTYAVSKVERYLSCPFKYFAGHVLQLDEEREDESGLSPQERGQLLHGVFEAFFTAWRERGGGAVTPANLDDAIALFADVAESELLALPEADRALERTYLLGSAASPGLAERAFAFEIEQGTGLVERLLEFTLEGAFRFEDGERARTVHIRGKADRIDLLADGTLRIVDYKLGRAPKTGRALQLPIYGVSAAQQLAGRHGRQWSVGRAGYLAFKEKNPFVDLGGRGGNVSAALLDGQRRFLAAIDRIEAGEFPPSPDEAWTCNRCGYSHVCRKDYVGDE